MGQKKLPNASVVWILGMGIYFLKATYDQSVRLNVQHTTAQEFSIALIVGAILAFVPVLLFWGFIYLVIFLVRWVNRPPESAKPQPQTPVTPVPRARDHLWKKVRLGLAGLCVLGVLGGGGYYAWTRYVTWRELTRTCREWEGKHPVGSPLDLDVGKLERQFVWDPRRGCFGPLEDAYSKREIAWREEQQKNGVKDYP